MTAKIVRCLVVLLLAGCDGVPPPPDAASVAPQTFGGYQDPDVGAMKLAEYAFSDAARTYGKPAEAARALAALDYMAGELSSSIRWPGVSDTVRQRMLAARLTMRQAMGIDPAASSQEVVDALLAAAAPLAAGDDAKAAALLPPPVFPADMVKRLGDMPYNQGVNAATMEAGNQMMVGISDNP